MRDLAKLPYPPHIYQPTEAGGWLKKVLAIYHANFDQVGLHHGWKDGTEHRACCTVTADGDQLVMQCCVCAQHIDPVKIYMFDEGTPLHSIIFVMRHACYQLRCGPRFGCRYCTSIQTACRSSTLRRCLSGRASRHTAPRFGRTTWAQAQSMCADHHRLRPQGFPLNSGQDV